MSEQSQKTETRQVSEAKYLALFNEARDGIVLVDSENGRIMDCNPEFERLCGRKREQLNRMKVWELRPRAKQPEAQKIFSKIRKHGSDKPIESEYETPAGKIVPIEFVARPITIDGYTYQQGIVRDISARKQTEAALRASEDRYRKLFESSRDAIFITTVQGRFLDCNPAALELVGYTRAELMQMHVTQIYANPADRDDFVKKIVAKGSVRDYELQIRGKDGEVRECQLSTTSRQDENGDLVFQTIMRDATARKRAERALQQSEERYQSFYDQAPDMYFIVAPDGTVQSVNEFGAKHLGYEKEELANGPVWVVVHPDDLKRVQKQVKAIFKNKVEKDELQFRKVKKDGSVLWVQEHTQLMLDAEDEATALLIICRDVTERERALRALKESEERYHALFEEAPIALWEVDIAEIHQYLRSLKNNGVENLSEYLASHPEEVEACFERFKILDVNRAALELIQTDSKDQFIAEIRSIIIEESFKAFEQQLIAIQQGRTGNQIETTIQTLRGNKVNVLLKWTVVPGVEVKFSKVFVAITDITERKRAHEKLRASRERLRALTGHMHQISEGERVSLARDVHDELGGALTSLKIDLTVLERKLKKNRTLELTSILQEIQRMKSVIDATVMDVRKIVRELRPDVLDSFGLLAALEWQIQEFQKRTGLDYEFRPGDDEIELDDKSAIAIFRIFQEALTNIARHAQAKKVSIGIRRNRNDLVFEIKDDGVGISKDKLRGADTFGLLGMRERALMFGGEVDVRRQKGKGTVVRIRVPHTDGNGR